MSIINSPRQEIQTLTSTDLQTIPAQRSRQTAAQKRSTPKFASDIAGLRTIAVLAVVLFHLGVVAGGEMGVDVFFVISGFLIVGRLVDSTVRSGRVNAADFWAKRIRRLMPMSTLTILVTVALAMLVLTPHNSSLTASMGALFALCVGNIAFINGSTSFENTPLLHLWSSSVENQFYIVLPLVLIGLLFLCRKRTHALKPVMALFLILTGAASFSFAKSEMQASYVGHDVAAYFGAMARWWEIALGGLLALAIPVIAKSGIRIAPRLANMLAALSLATIVAILVFGHYRDGWTTWVALVAATMVLIAIGQLRSSATSTLLGSRPFTYFGERSYSIYLVSLPMLILTIAAMQSGTLPGELQFPDPHLMCWATAFATLFSVGIGCLAYRFIEKPMRTARLLASNRNAFIFAAGAIGAICLLCAFVACSV